MPRSHESGDPASWPPSVRPPGQDEDIGPLTSSVEYRQSLDNSIGCGCGMADLAIDPGDTVRGNFMLRRVGRLKDDEGGTLVIWALEGVVVPGGTIVDCAQFFPSSF